LYSGGCGCHPSSGCQSLYFLFYQVRLACSTAITCKSTVCELHDVQGLLVSLLWNMTGVAMYEVLPGCMFCGQLTRVLQSPESRRYVLGNQKKGHTVDMVSVAYSESSRDVILINIFSWSSPSFPSTRLAAMDPSYAGCSSTTLITYHILSDCITKQLVI
jgi:hypothetical protein